MSTRSHCFGVSVRVRARIALCPYTVTRYVSGILMDAQLKCVKDICHLIPTGSSIDVHVQKAS